MTPRLKITCVAAGLLVLAGCDYAGPTSLPLPAGTSAGDDPYRVTVVFDDASNLAPKGSCRANDVPVGYIESVKLGADLKARVVCLVDRNAKLPANAVGTLSETSLLGERFVAFGPPPGQQPAGRLAADAVLADAGNRVEPNVEQVLGALSGVLNGGGLARVQTINRELNAALSGREGDVRAVLGDLATLTRHLNQHSGDITGALDSMDKLTRTLARQDKAIGAAIDAIPDGLEVLNRQRPKLVKLLDRLGHLSDVATPVIEQSKRDTVADLKLLRPILRELDNAGSDLNEALHVLTTYPFPTNAMAAMRGDYFGLNATVNLNLDTVNKLLESQLGQPPTTAKPGPTRPGTPTPGLPLPEIGLPEEPPLDLGELLTGGL